VKGEPCPGRGSIIEPVDPQFIHGKQTPLCELEQPDWSFTITNNQTIFLCSKLPIERFFRANAVRANKICRLNFFCILETREIYVETHCEI